MIHHLHTTCLRATSLPEISHFYLALEFARMSKLADATSLTKWLWGCFMSSFNQASKVLICLLEFNVIYFHCCTLMGFGRIKILSILRGPHVLQVALSYRYFLHAWTFTTRWRGVVRQAWSVSLVSMTLWTLALSLGAVHLVRICIGWWEPPCLCLVLNLHLFALNLQLL